MAEESWPWPGTTVGDAGPYSDDDWDNMWETLYGSGVAPYNNRGVIRNWLNELVVTTPGVNAVDVDTGAALVHGKFYRNTAVVNVVGIPSAAGGVGHTWREDLICVRSSWIAQTIRVYRHANPADEVGYPAPTQTDGTCWEIPLYAVRINAAGTITLITDLRDYLFVTELQREIQKRPMLTSASTAIYSWGLTAHFFVVIAPNEDCFFELLVPPDFRQIEEVIIYAASSVNRTFNWQVNTAWANCNEVRELHSDSASGAASLVISYELECIDVSAAFDAAPITPGDLIGIRLRHISSSPSGDVEIFMLAFRYK